SLDNCGGVRPGRRQGRGRIAQGDQVLNGLQPAAASPARRGHSEASQRARRRQRKAAERADPGIQKVVPPCPGACEGEFLYIQRISLLLCVEVVPSVCARHSPQTRSLPCLPFAAHRRGIAMGFRDAAFCRSGPPVSADSRWPACCKPTSSIRTIDLTARSRSSTCTWAADRRTWTRLT